ncbi:hypothetical protein EYF80_051347 [Liparis tanakae]|uniref:Uncharacterized protein n=1 Tax=Liparis tanakae TaxID=230148 RepID=A0A4Z2FBB6_9TELE|nr:hypothetical protein EYF80_051347 [Liparis tanakae]
MTSSEAVGRYLGVPVGDQSDAHDVLQHGPGGEELPADEGSAGRTQTLIVQNHGHGGNRLAGSGGVQLHALLLHLQEEEEKKSSDVKLNVSEYTFIKETQAKNLLTWHAMEISRDRHHWDGGYRQPGFG